MSKKKKTLKIYIDYIEQVVSLKSLNEEERQELYILLQDLVINTPDIPLINYQESLVRGFLDNPKLLDDLDEGDRNEVILAIYVEITKGFSAYKIENVCASINANQILEEIFEDMGPQDMSKVFEEHLASVKAISGKSTLKIRSLEDVLLARRYFKNNIIGQEGAITTVCDTIKLMASELESHASIFFIGPTGVGKTALAKALGKRYSGNFCRINCAEYASGHEYSKLIGSPPGYVGHGEKGILTRKAEESNSWVFLFDEIEKAHDKLFSLLLSMMDEGVISNNTGQELDFTNSIFVFTSNEGLKDLKMTDTSIGFGLSESVDHDKLKEHCEKALKSKFSPEFLNRIDEVVYFRHLTQEDALKIASLELKSLPIRRTKEILNYVVDNGYSLEYGAREIKRFIKSHVTLKIAEAILSKKLPKNGKRYKYLIQGNDLYITDTKPYISDGLSVQMQAPDVSGS